MNFYIATWKQENARPVRDAIVAAGHACTATWLDLPDYRSIQGTDEQKQIAAETCEREVRECDELILVAEPDGSLVRGGKHVEMGMALAMGKSVHVIGKPENIFHWHPRVRVHSTIEEMLTNLSQIVCDNCGRPMEGRPADPVSGINLCRKCSAT